MATLTRHPQPSGSPSTPAAAVLALPSGPKKRYRPARIALAVVLMAVVGLGALYLYRSASQSAAVVQVRSDIARGTVIKTTDLTSVTIGTTPGVPTVPADQLQSMVGR